MNNKLLDHEIVAYELAKAVEGKIDDQVMDKERVDYGGYYSHDLGFASPCHTESAKYLSQLSFAYLFPYSKYYGDPYILKRILAAIEFQKRCQRSSGFIDLRSQNYDSPPDTAFVISRLACVAWMALNDNGTRGAAEIESALKPYLISSAKALTTGGFHTPNHRWVIVAAMAQVKELYPEIAVEEAINEYLAEGIDINADGLYSEKSTGVYNAVVDRKLIFAAEALNQYGLLKSVRMNLNCMIDLMHDDWSVVTSISIRQDKGKSTIPLENADSFYYMARLDGNERFIAAARALFGLGGCKNEFFVYLFARHPEWCRSELGEGKMSESYIKHMSESGIWRVRRGKLSATLATESVTPFSVKYGEVELSGVGVHLPYFSGAKYTGRQITASGNKAKILIKSEFHPEQPALPAFWLPLGKPVAFNELPYKNVEERKLNKRPEFEVLMDIEEVDAGFNMNIQTLGGIAAVIFSLSFFFKTPGHVETEQLSFPADATKSTIILKQGYLTYQTNRDAITIGPGFWGVRGDYHVGVGPDSGLCSVVMTDWTPVNRKVEIHYSRWSEAYGECISVKGPGSGFANRN